MTTTAQILTPIHPVQEQPEVWHLKTAHGWAEVCLDDLADLASFLGKSPEETLDALRGYEYGRMGKAWREKHPTTSEEQRAFYSQDDSYLYSLTLWQLAGKYNFYHDMVQQMSDWQRSTSTSRRLRALDYGAGIGTSALWLAQLGYDVTVADVPGPSLRYTQHRFARRGLPVRAVSITSDQPDLGEDPFDVICCFDVLEHVPQVKAVTENLLRHVRQPGGFFAVVAPFDEVEGAYAGPHLAENQRLFGGGHFELWLSGQGFARLPGGFIWWPTHGRASLSRRLHYALYWTTGLDVRPKRPGWKRR